MSTHAPPPNKDLTPDSGSETDVAPLGRGEKPFHEKTAAEDFDPVDWEQVNRDPAYRSLIRRKTRFIAVLCVIFTLYYFALPILVGFFPTVMERLVWGRVNLAYFFALSQFLMAWVLASVYVAAAGRFDHDVARVLASLTASGHRA
jgi:uncharacterized membrane protein (DUF485 family)